MLKRDQRSGAEFAAGAQTKPELLNYKDFWTTTDQACLIDKTSR